MVSKKELKEAVEKTSENSAKTKNGYTVWVYIGPALPSGQLKSNAVIKGTREEVLTYHKDLILEYPQVARLIVPVAKLGEASLRAKTPGNITHKYYNDIVSTMQKREE